MNKLTISEIKQKVQLKTDKNLSGWTFFFNEQERLEFYNTSKNKSSVFTGNVFDDEEIKHIANCVNKYQH